MYYRHRKKIDQPGVALAVLIQPMVHAESAGVMFTRDPMGSGDDEIVIHSIWGLGTPLMGARIRPDEFRVNKATGEIREHTVEEQVVKLVVGADGHTEEQAVAAELVNAPSLTDAQAVQLAKVGRGIEGRFGSPQDIEWAVAGEDIYVLQARPMQVRTS
jgi:pyruvate,water dikinase